MYFGPIKWDPDNPFSILNFCKPIEMNLMQMINYSNLLITINFTGHLLDNEKSCNCACCSSCKGMQPCVITASLY